MNKKDTTLDVNKFKIDHKDIIEKKKLKSIRITGMMERETCMKVLTTLEQKKNLNGDINLAMALITGVVQNGGSNRNAGTNISFSIDNKSLNASELQNIIQTTEKNATTRQFCRTMADEIQEFAEMLKIEGDLAKQMRINYPKMSDEESIWCSNFQTTNPNCPESVRKWLVENYQKRFRN